MISAHWGYDQPWCSACFTESCGSTSCAWRLPDKLEICNLFSSSFTSWPVATKIYLRNLTVNCHLSSPVITRLSCRFVLRTRFPSSPFLACHFATLHRSFVRARPTYRFSNSLLFSVLCYSFLWLTNDEGDKPVCAIPRSGAPRGRPHTTCEYSPRSCRRSPPCW